MADGPIVYTPVDEKPKRSPNVAALARVRDIDARPSVTLLADRWDEEWGRLGWIRMYGTAALLAPNDADAPEHAAAVALLRAKYEQYRTHRLEALPVIRIALERVVTWGDVSLV